MRCFASETFKKRIVIESCSGTQMYTNLFEDENAGRTYSTRLISVSIQEFHTFTVFISNNVKDKKTVMPKVARLS